MNASQRILFDRLMAFQIDEPTAELTFARRLARENRWTIAYAERVIVEYKKFLFLAVTAGHIVSPSEQVDQAWHLHLTYTRSYWDELCRKILGQPMHHNPTVGGVAEQAKFIDLYNQTLHSYRQFFNEEPPADIWSPAEKRFGEDLQHVSVNTSRFWVIPKLRLPSWPYRSVLPQRMPLFAAALFVLPLALAAWNPLDWTGPDFLFCYFLVTVGATLLAFIARLTLSAADASPHEKAQPKLSAYEAACLAAGPVRTVQAAFASMVHACTLRLESETTQVLGIFPRVSRRVYQGKKLPANAHYLEHALYAESAAAPANLAPLFKAGVPIAEEIRDSLIQRGLIESPWPTTATIVAGTIMLSPLVLGIPKIFIGLSRGKPVEFLVIGCVITFVAALLFLLAKSRITTRGRAMLQSLQSSHASAASLNGTTSAILSPTELAMAIGLFGAGMLTLGPLADVHAMLPRRAGGGGCTAGGGGCGGGGCGGGGCGGGGCGGGGCGGCGGGG